MLWTTAVESSNLSFSHSSTFLIWEAGMGLAERAMMIVLSVTYRLSSTSAPLPIEILFISG